jgi:hypothetical protein
MTRNLKALGIALIAALAFGAISASTASAETKIEGALTTTPDGTANMVGQESGGNHKFELGGAGTLECEEVEMHSHISGATTAATVSSTYNKCSFNLFGTKRPTTITMNGCEFIMTVHQFYAGSGEGTGQGHLVCPESKAIEIHLYNNGAHTELRCTYHIAPQTVSTGISFQTMKSGPEGKSTMTVIINKAPVIAKKTSGTVLQCGGSEFSSSYIGTFEILATNANAEPVDLEGVED